MLLIGLIGVITPLPIIFVLINTPFKIVIIYLIASAIFISLLSIITNKFMLRNFTALEIVQKLKE